MKNTISALVIAASLAAGSAYAADLPSRNEAPVYIPPPVFSWTGFYAGLNIGGGWRNNSNNNGFVGNGTNSAGVVGGGQISFNFQFSPLFVGGVETDFQGTSIGSGGGGFGLNERITYFGTVRSRIGIITPFNPNLLIYGTGGFAYGEVRQDDGFFQNRNTRTGWTAGGGVEWAFLPNWSAKVEYLYTDLNSNSGNGCEFFGDHCQTRFNTVRAGVNYHFNMFAPAPVVAKY
jgi:outer membrane immunogenic protein